MKTVAIIQARTGSTRLPNKVMMPILKKPMLLRVCERVSMAKSIDKVVVATTHLEEDDVIGTLCKENKIKCYRGSVDNVFNRYLTIGKRMKATTVVRITGDCPLVDPDTIDGVVNNYLEHKARYHGASNIIERTFPHGLDVEVFGFYAFIELSYIIEQDYQREHVTAGFYEKKNGFNILSIMGNKDLSHLRWTVDEKEDLEFVREVYKRLGDSPFNAKDVVELLEQNPEIGEINNHIKQKDSFWMRR